MKKCLETKCYLCNEKISAKGLCFNHYRVMLRRNIDMDNRILVKSVYEELLNKKKCYFCGKTAASKGLCKSHYNTVKKRGIDINDRDKIIKLLEDLKIRKICSKCGKRMIHKDDLCIKCLNNL